MSNELWINEQKILRQFNRNHQNLWSDSFEKINSNNVVKNGVFSPLCIHAVVCFLRHTFKDYFFSSRSCSCSWIWQILSIYFLVKVTLSHWIPKLYQIVEFQHIVVILVDVANLLKCSIQREWKIFYFECFVLKYCFFPHQNECLENLASVCRLKNSISACNYNFGFCRHRNESELSMGLPLVPTAIHGWSRWDYCLTMPKTTYIYMVKQSLSVHVTNDFFLIRKKIQGNF